MSSAVKNLKLKITGIVQGVGFRPFIYSLAQKNNLKGWVLNSSKGVEIEISGFSADLDKFVADMRNQTPPLARIDRVLVEEVAPIPYENFSILSSTHIPGDYGH